MFLHRKLVEIRIRTDRNQQERSSEYRQSTTNSGTLALFGTNVSADSLRVIHRDLAPVPPAQAIPSATPPHDQQTSLGVLLKSRLHAADPRW